MPRLAAWQRMFRTIELRFAGADLMAERAGLPVTVEYLGPNEVLDRSAMFRGPKISNPSVMSDWRGDGRKTITVMEALLEWPRFDARTLLHFGRRQLRNARRRPRILREDSRRVPPSVRRVRELVIELASSVSCQLDGEEGGSAASYSVRAVPRALAVRVPA